MEIHKEFMSIAIKNAKKGYGKVSPNPLVGCILVKEGKIIGEGYHHKFGDPHAEVMAIRNAFENPAGSTAYITLEPCCTVGKTPPCTEALIDNQIAEVYIANIDPNPDHSGFGINVLEQAGINVYTDLLKEEAAKINKGYFHWIKTGRPYVIAKIAQTRDGFMGYDSNSSIWITSNQSKIHTHELRSKIDAIMVGTQTAFIDNPSLTVESVSGHNPIRVIVDSDRKLPLHLKVFNDEKAPTIVLCSNANFERSKTSFCQYISVNMNSTLLSEEGMLDALGKEGVTSLLIEGGRQLLQSFLNKNLIDEVYLYTSPKIIKNASLTNPFLIDDDWEVVNKKYLGEDKLLILERAAKCLQVL